MSDLNDKPAACPFCKAEGARARMMDGYIAVMCEACNAEGPPHQSSIEAIEAWNRRATPAPQAAPSDDLHIETGLRLRLVCEKLALSKAVPEDPAEIWAVAFSVLGMVRHEIENLQRAAAPAVAITQAATSEPVAWIFDDLEILLETDSEIQYGMRKRSQGRPLVYGDFATPVAHLSGTTPNTEAPSDERAAFEAWAVDYFGGSQKSRQGDGYLYNDINYSWRAWQARAALSAQQAGVQEKSHD